MLQTWAGPSIRQVQHQAQRPVDQAHSGMDTQTRQQQRYIFRRIAHR